MNIENNIENLKQRIGIEWNNLSLLTEALTHSSFAYETKGRAPARDNERLEFLGDAVLELIVSEYLYNLCREKTEGELTKMRARIVCEPSLASISQKIKLGRCLYMGRGEERSGGRERPSLLADAFEALLGAIYLDQGYDTAKDFALNELAEVIGGVLKGNFERDYKTELQELLQRHRGDPVKYQLVDEEGPDHNKVFTAAAYCRGEMLGKGKGHSKKEAEQKAARVALGSLEESSKSGGS